MTEPEVILRIALYYLKNHLTDEDIYVSIDGAHVKTGNTVHFDIWSFLKENGCIHINDASERWQGEYKVTGCEYNLVIISTPGVGDVKVHLEGGKELLVEAKKGKTYYVKVRAYKVDSASKKVYGSYSSVKTVTVKK